MTEKLAIRPRAKKVAWALTLVYFASYMMRINFAVMLVKICSDMSLQKTDLAIVVTGLTATYGAGQIFSGILGDKFKPEHMLSVGLALASICNAAMFFTNDVTIMTIIWSINGFAHALLWPPIVRIMSTYLSDMEYSYAAVRVSWGSSFATILLYLVCPLLLSWFTWRTIMVICAVVGMGIMIFWTIYCKKILIEPYTLRNTGVTINTKESKALPKFVYLPIVLISLGIALQGILRDGVTNWMPSYLLESFGLPEEMAIVATVILAIFSVISFCVFDIVHRKLFRNEVFCASMIFVLSIISSTIMYLLNILGLSNVFVSMLCMAFIVAAMHGINLMLITVVPKRFVKLGKVSTFSGFFNAFTYVGAAISIYVFALLAEKFGWNATVLSWILVSVAGFLVCLAASKSWKKFCEEMDKR